MSLNLTCREMFKRKGTYWHLFPEQAQARKAIWNGIDGSGRRILDQVFPGFIKAMGGRRASGIVQRTSSQEMLIELTNGSNWQMAGSDNYNSLVGSNVVGVVLSEWSLANPEAWDYIRPILLENGGWAIFIFTPRGRNHGYETFQMALHNNTWLADLKTIEHTGRISQELIQEERDSGMTESKIQQEYYCDFEAETEEQFIPTDYVNQAIKRPNWADPADEVVIGVDVARFGDDKSVIYVRRGFDARSMPPRIFEKLDTMQLAGHVAEDIQRHKPDGVFIDEGAMGPGVIDRLRQLGFDVQGINFGSASTRRVEGAPKAADKRTEIWAALREALKSGLQIPDDQRLKFELLAPLYDFNSKNQIKLESKDDMKKRGIASPDIADALALTYAMPVVARSFQAHIEDQEDDDWNPVWGSN